MSQKEIHRIKTIIASQKDETTFQSFMVRVNRVN